MPEPTAACDLCGLPLRFGAISHELDGRAYRFCCMGCRQVFAMLLAAAEPGDPADFRNTELFRRCQEMGVIPRSAADLARRRQQPLCATAPPPPAAGHGAQLQLTLKIADMWCPACAWVIEETLRHQKGVLDAACNFATDRLRCSFDPVRSAPADIIRTIEKLGYRAALPDDTGTAKESRREFIRFGVSAFLTMNVMMLSFALYTGFFSALSAESVFKISWPIFFMASAVLFYGGGPIYRKALAAARTAHFGMETLVAVGALAAYGFSTYNLLHGSIHLYFDTVAMLTTLVLLGKALERRAKDAVQEELGTFFALQPAKVHLLSPAAPGGRYVAAEMLQPGDRFQVAAGEVVAADGTILSGSAEVDESSLTGEPRPLAKTPGERLRSGVRITRGVLTLRAEQVGPASTLGQMLAIIQKALDAKTRLEGRTDRLLQWFVPAILLLALLTGLVCLWAGLTGEAAMIRAVTVVVISCPCALGVAIPLARVAGISVAGRGGILVREFSAFEAAQQVDTLVFDKTGTLTDGRWTLLAVRPLGAIDSTHALQLAFSLEDGQTHPIAAAIQRKAEAAGLQRLPMEDRTVSENGIAARLAGRRVRIGSALFAGGGAAPAPPGAAPEDAEDSPRSRVYLSLDDQPAAVFDFGDTLRPSAATTLGALKGMGYALALVSGDEDAATRRVGRTLGIAEAAGGLLPHAKANYIKRRQQRGACVAMVGDGVNDAPAMAQAQLAIAMHSGSHLSQETADITLMRGDPAQIMDFLTLGRRVSAKIRQNLACAFVYNLIAIPLAVSGLLTPLVAVSAMLLSSLTVIGNTLRLVRRAA